MDIDTARGVAARIWCDHEMSSIVMDAGLAEDIAQLLASRLTPNAVDVCHVCGMRYTDGANNFYRQDNCPHCGTRR